MECSVTDRLVLLQVLAASPIAGNYLTIKIARKLQESLSFTEAEHKELELTATNGHVKWNAAKDTPKDIEMGEQAIGLIKAGFKAMDEKKTLTMEYLDLYEKFMVEPCSSS